MFKEIFNQLKGPPKQRSCSSSYQGITDPKRGFSIYVGKEAFDYWNSLVGLTYEDIIVSSQRVHDKCRDLGFLCRKKIKFYVEVQPVKSQPNREIYVARAVSISRAGDNIDRSLVAHVPSVNEEIEKMRMELVKAVQVTRLLGKKEGQLIAEAMLDNFPKTMAVKYKMIFTHELVHLFATDEYEGICKRLPLADLELLTDAINVLIFHDEHQHDDAFKKFGFTEGVGYIVNQVQKEQSTQNPIVLMERVHKRAHQILKASQEILSPEKEVVQNQGA
jgi:hypothetical protein